jgi:hypothetical protein
MLDVTESSLIQLRGMDDTDAAIFLDARLRELEAQWKRTFIERGLILLEMEQRLLWKYLTNPLTSEPYTSFERWIVTAAPQSRSDAYAALRAVKELRDIPREHLEAIPRCNVHILQSLSTAVRNEPEVLKAAREMSEREFVRHVQKHHPLQAIEARRKIQFTMPGGDVSLVEQSIQECMEKEQLSTKEDVLMFWALEYSAENMGAEDGR